MTHSTPTNCFFIGAGNPNGKMDCTVHNAKNVSQNNIYGEQRDFCPVGAKLSGKPSFPR